MNKILITRLFAILFVAISLLFYSFSFCISDAPESWTHFRGSELNGLSPFSKPPIKFSTDSLMSWKADLIGYSLILRSSNQVFKIN